ncbi:MAG: alpha-amylase family protein [Gemmatimonadota bacterium]
MPRSSVLAGALVVLVSAATACRSGPTTPPPPGTQAGRPVLDPTYRPSGHMAAGDVAVRLFQWSWRDVAAECESELGPDGYAAVLVSPPQEHTVLTGSPWWEHYQPVSYSIERTTFGTKAEFEDMVQRCQAAGIDIYVDAVINHMTAGSGTGSDGTVYTKYDYPGLYAPDDFHPPCTVDDYQSAANVQDCELLGLADLNTGLASVRHKIAGYLIALAHLGVAGFRIDAAKHIQPVELDSVLFVVDSTLTSEGRPLPYYFAEVIDNGGEAVHASGYDGLAYSSGGAADITEFRFRGVGDKFLRTDGQRLADLNPDGPAGHRFSEAAWGLMPSDKAVVFLENHDTQRNGGIGYRDGQKYRLANVWMLAQPYGYPFVMSSYAFDRSTQAGRDAGPPPGGDGTQPLACAASMETAQPGDWVCEHRDPMIVAMVRFRRIVAGTPVDHWWDDGADAIAFSRGDRGFVAINHDTAAVDTLIATGMPAGSYCDLLTGGLAGGACAGTSLVVDSTGAVRVQLAANAALAIDADTRM